MATEYVADFIAGNECLVEVVKDMMMNLIIILQSQTHLRNGIHISVLVLQAMRLSSEDVYYSILH